MAATVTVLYPSGPAFNMSYYLEKHMTLVESKWGQSGLKNWSVTQFGPEQQYQVAAFLTFGSQEEVEASASGEHAPEIMGDVVNFTEAKPILLMGKVVGAQK